jgi:hypothetical protein
MNRIIQEAKKREAAVKLANRKGQSFASRMYGCEPVKRKALEKRG